MKPDLFLVAGVLVAVMAFAGCMAPDDGDAPEATLVKMQNVKFDPQEITITAGETVLWRNLDSVVHTVTSDNESFDSGNLRGAETFTYTFEEPGTYTYHCDPHAFQNDDGEWTGMVGTVIVEAAEE